MKAPVLMIALVAALAASSPARAQSSRERAPQQPERETAPELHAAIRDAYLQEFRTQLALTDEKQRDVEPLLVEMLALQRDTTRHARELRQRVMNVAEAGGTDADATAAVEALLENEMDAAHRVQASRERISSKLTPRQAALAATFEGPFRQRMRALAAGRAPDAPPGGDAAPGRTAPPSRRGMSDERADEMRDTLRLVFAHEARTSLGLDDAETLALLPRIDTLLAARQNALRARRQSQDELRRLADDASATDTALRSALDAARKSEASSLDALIAARRGLVRGISGLDAAKLTAVDLRMQQEAGHRLGDRMRQGGPRDGERGDQGDRPMGPWRRQGSERR